jgi:hypothetical protein
MNLKRIVGSIVTDKGPQPFVLHVQTGRLEVGSYAEPDLGQADLSVIQQQRFAQLIHERANVSFAQVRLGQYRCPECGEWIGVTAPGAWRDALCASCAPEQVPEPASKEAPPPALPADKPTRDVIKALLGEEEDQPLERAIQLAVEVHRGQQDKAGAPYILHPLRMMLRMDTPEAMMAAVLHDVVEDSEWTLDGLRYQGFPEVVVEAVARLTRHDGESYEAFIERAAQHPLARRVKLADLEDNMDVRRLGPLSKEDTTRLAKYQKAWRQLQERDGS